MNYKTILCNESIILSDVNILDTSVSSFPKKGEVFMKCPIDKMGFETDFEIYSKVDGKEHNFSIDLLFSQLKRLIFNSQTLSQYSHCYLAKKIKSTNLFDGTNSILDITLSRDDSIDEAIDFIFSFEDNSKYVIEISFSAFSDIAACFKE